ncbi:carboxy terminal-processing peptidase [Geoalkalibacter halelectricus]|uniref:Carboxy terminal-processing peptidase n=1 Tax=Geoalkalibacter halelectricus TaxID=2847045 RepID=A0ABY5ZNW8_9BACT|nr:carboxy terminal-processing peptidase [Geoalkalibacter halelectricus]MDO3378476.1 carboxy terminal-processing peptidase [Geoalkalibacter halelectricus]UWZ80204.1 carboxy terminal-processing peptidase [Geoalkalibacter halelectricus]
MPTLKKLLAALLVLLLLAPGYAAAVPADPGDYDLNRARLLSFVLRQQLVSHHYSHKPLDDALSVAAFGLYLKQLDFQKRFLLKEDVKRLRAYEKQIDDEIATSRIELPLLAAELMEKRVRQIQGMLPEILAAGFDFARDETIETDPDKLEFAKSADELRERWRKILKQQVINRLLIMEETEQAKDATQKQKTSEELLTAAIERIGNNQEQMLNRMLEDTRQDHIDRYFNAVARAFDPHSNYLPPTSKEDFDISMRGSLEGIGATLREEDGFIRVVRIIPGSAAYRQGQLEAEDTILAVAEGGEEPVDVVDRRLRDAVSLIRGKKGTEVRLTVRKPDGRTLIVPIVRDVVQIEETFVRSALLPAEESGKQFGYIKIPTFYRDFDGGPRGSGRNSTDDMRQELMRLNEQGIDGLVLDLRNNGGGALTDAVSIAGLFIKEGPIVQVRGGDGRTETLTDRSRDIVYDGPLVVLVNKFSASASEILAGALQDYGRAVVIGSEYTHGKGTVQAVIDLDRSLPFPNMDRYRPLGAIKVTIQKFYRISGESTQYRGVVPDIILPDRLRHIESGEQYLDYSLPWDKVTPIRFTPWPQDLPIDKLRQASEERIAADEEFRTIAADAERARERMKQTTLPLNLEEARQARRELLQQREDSPPHDQGMAAEDSVEPGLSSEERQQRWARNAAEDPYVGEAQAVLRDLFRLRSAGSATTAGPVQAPAVPH